MAEQQTTALTRADPLITDRKELKDFCASVAVAGFIGGKATNEGEYKTKVATALCKAQAGMELGIGPWTAQNAFHSIDGKLAMSAGTMAALIKRSGEYDYR